MLSMSLQGYEGAPKGRKKYRDCCNSFDVKVKIKYKNNREDHFI